MATSSESSAQILPLLHLLSVEVRLILSNACENCKRRGGLILFFLLSRHKRKNQRKGQDCRKIWVKLRLTPLHKTNSLASFARTMFCAAIPFASFYIHIFLRSLSKSSTCRTGRHQPFTETFSATLCFLIIVSGMTPWRSFRHFFCVKTKEMTPYILGACSM